jgi:hypothetical protein
MIFGWNFLRPATATLVSGTSTMPGYDPMDVWDVDRPMNGWRATDAASGRGVVYDFAANVTIRLITILGANLDVEVGTSTDNVNYSITNVTPGFDARSPFRARAIVDRGQAPSAFRYLRLRSLSGSPSDGTSSFWIGAVACAQMRAQTFSGEQLRYRIDTPRAGTLRPRFVANPGVEIELFGGRVIGSMLQTISTLTSAAREQPIIVYDETTTSGVYVVRMVEPPVITERASSVAEVTAMRLREVR